MRCAACGAGIAADDLACPYCGQVTAHGAWKAHHDQQHAQAQAALELHREHTEQLARAAAAKREVQQAASRALYWSIGGLVLCCGFIPSIVGLVLALRARKAAQENQLDVPTSATTALVLSLIAILLGVGLITIGVVEDRKRTTRVEAIDKLLGDSARNSPLLQPTACLLAERRLLTEGWDDNKTISEFECDGRLQQTADSAVLSAMRFKKSQDRVTAAACLQKGERWSVVRFSKSDCTDSDVAGTGSGSVPASSKSSASAP